MTVFETNILKQWLYSNDEFYLLPFLSVDERFTLLADLFFHEISNQMLSIITYIAHHPHDRAKITILINNSIQEEEE